MRLEEDGRAPETNYSSAPGREQLGPRHEAEAALPLQSALHHSAGLCGDLKK